MFIICLILGVTIMAAVNTLASVVKNTLNEEAQSLLGGHIEVTLGRTLATPEQREKIAQYGKVSHVATMRTMIQHNDDLHLVEAKAIDAHYPLLGQITLKQSMTIHQAIEGNGLAVDPIVLSQYALKLGDEVQIGQGKYILRAIIDREPDRVVQLMSFGPRVMMSHESLQQSGLMGNLTLMGHSYRLQVDKPELIDPAYLKKIHDELKEAYPKTAWRVRNGTEGNVTIKRFMDQLLGFLTLSGLATFLIAGIGIGSAVRAYLEKKSPTIAVLKVQGASRKLIFRTYMLVLAMLAIAGGLIGVLIAAAITTQLVPMLIEVLPAMEGETGIHLPSSLLAMWYGILIVYLFSMPSLLGALNVRPSILFRSKLAILELSTDKSAQNVVAFLTGLLLITLFLSTSDVGLILGAVSLAIISFGLFDLCIRLVKFFAKRIKVNKPWLRLALGNLHRPGSTVGTVIFAIGISLTVLIALTLTEANFRKRITEVVDRDAPALFIIDIQSHQKETLENILAPYSTPEQVMILPMARGRIIKINGEDVADREIERGSKWAVRGDRGLSYSAKPLPNANIVEGKWWGEDYKGEPQISIDDRFLDGMHVKMGDTFTFQIMGEEITATITSARKIDYSTFQINFSNMFSPGVIDDFPHSYVATVYLNRDQVDEAALVKTMAQQLPSITVIRTSEVVDLVRGLMTNIALALRVTVGISLFAGLLVLISALSSSVEQRLYDTAILKVLGARQKEILKCCLAEWTMLAIATSVIAASMGTLGAYLVTERFRIQEFSFMPLVTLSTIFLCVLTVWITGYFGNRRLFKLRPASLLRNE